MKTVKKIEVTRPVLPTRKKVAAYARVSMESDRMMHSLSTQVSYYNELIQSNPEWEFAGVYADNFISGTAIDRRPEFKRLLDDCEAGKIDIVLTKSISRFARNTVDLLETVRHLKELGIEVQFEKEHINSLSDDGELMLSLLASFAQEESRSISENARWAIQKRFEKGIPNGHFRVYGYLDEASVKERFTVAVNQLLAGRDTAIAAYELGMAKTLDTTELETQQQELLSEMEVLNGMIQQMILQNATVAQDQTEYNQRFDALSQKFKEAESKKDAVAQQISDIRDRRGTMEDFLRILKQQDGEVTAFSEKLWCGLLDYATAYADGRLTFTFKNGSTFEG